jgi:hypothetical protein
MRPLLNDEMCAGQNHDHVDPVHHLRIDKIRTRRALNRSHDTRLKSLRIDIYRIHEYLSPKQVLTKSTSRIGKKYKCL